MGGVTIIDDMADSERIGAEAPRTPPNLRLNTVPGAGEGSLLCLAKPSIPPLSFGQLVCHPLVRCFFPSKLPFALACFFSRTQMASPVASPTLRFSADASPPSYFPPTSLSVSTLDSKMIQGNSSPPSTATFPPRQGGAKAGALAPYGPGEWQPITRQKTKGTYTCVLPVERRCFHWLT